MGSAVVRPRPVTAPAGMRPGVRETEQRTGQPPSLAGWRRQGNPLTWCTFLAVLGPLLVGCRAQPPDEKKPPADTRQEAEAPDRQRVGDGIYAVLREGRREEVG